MSNYTEIAKLLKRLSPFDAFLLSFFALPFIVQAWLDALQKMEFSQCARNWSIGAVVVLYVIGAGAVVVSNNRSKRSEVAKDQVLAYLQSKSLTFASFDRIRERVNAGYSDEFLERLPHLFPQDVRCAKLRNGKRGIGRIMQEENNEA